MFNFVHITMTFKVWIRTANQFFFVSSQEDLPDPYNNANKWEWKDANQDESFDKFVVPRIPDAFFRDTSPLV